MDAIVVELSVLVKNYLSTALKEAGLEVHDFQSARLAIEAMEAGLHPSLVCTSLVTKDLSGIELRNLVAANPAWHDVKMALVTSSEGPETDSLAADAGFDVVIRKAELRRFPTWLAAFLAAVPETDPLRGRILYVEDSATAVGVLRQILRDRPVEIDAEPSVDAALARFEAERYDLVVADYTLEGSKNGLDLVRTLRARAGRHLPILVLSALESRERKIEILDAGANDFVAKPMLPGELVARLRILLENKHLIDELEAQKARLYELAMHDQLTGLFNRRSLFEIAPKLMADARRRKSHLAALLFDLDHFKQVNDRHGHETGDLVLREIGALLQSELREGDYAARFGGEEFFVLLPGCAPGDARTRAEALRARVETLEPGGLHVTASFGVASLVLEGPGAGANFDELFRRTDEAAYASKAGGRNRVTTAG